ncbi:hypothetical protein [Desulforhabdus sp. TSK]|uniref:hypothetical protein n=1 Tax=Desulforhabdus sp. TSK TaxID=2925014 RepID=UPI001FC8A263|nr:hypothetical protein [Desulforhabdus sp. TSK]
MGIRNSIFTIMNPKSSFLENPKENPDHLPQQKIHGRTERAAEVVSVPAHWVCAEFVVKIIRVRHPLPVPSKPLLLDETNLCISGR